MSLSERNDVGLFDGGADGLGGGTEDLALPAGDLGLPGGVGDLGLPGAGDLGLAGGTAVFD